MKKMGDLLKPDFPIFKRLINGYPLIYLDNAATTQKPQKVIDAMVSFYSSHNANVFRGIYTLAEEATTLFEESRQKIADFLAAPSKSLIFTSGATDGINFIASTIKDLVNPGESLLVTGLEHHSNILPWQRCAQEKGAQLVFSPVSDDGSLDMEQFEKMITPQTRLIAVSQVGNVFGTRQDIQHIVALARAVGAYVLVDAAQSVSHQRINVKDIDCDFLVFSGHKMFGPTGIGVLYIREELLHVLSPYRVGGGMVADVCADRAVWRDAPHKFEAGTPPIAQAIGLGAAVDYFLQTIDFELLKLHEALLCSRLIEGLSEFKRVKILGPINQLKLFGYQVSFTVDGIHPHDVAAYCDTFGICVRAGVHCAQLLAKALGIGASIRVSFHAYNTIEDVNRLLEVLATLAG